MKSTPEAIEDAIRAVAQDLLAVVPGLWIRTSRNQFKDTPANGEGGEVFPQLFISATPKYYENVNATWNVDVSFDIFTHIDDDPEGRQLAELETALEVFLDRLFAFDGGTDEQERFIALMREEFPDFTYGACYVDSAPAGIGQQDRARELSQTFTLHFSSINRR